MRRWLKFYLLFWSGNWIVFKALSLVKWMSMGRLNVAFQSCSCVSWPEAAAICYYTTKQQIHVSPRTYWFACILYQFSRMLKEANCLLHCGSPGASISKLNVWIRFFPWKTSHSTPNSPREDNCGAFSSLRPLYRVGRIREMLFNSVASRATQINLHIVPVKVVHSISFSFPNENFQIKFWRRGIWYSFGSAAKEAYIGNNSSCNEDIWQLKFSFLLVWSLDIAKRDRTIWGLLLFEICPILPVVPTLLTVIKAWEVRKQGDKLISVVLLEFNLMVFFLPQKSP